MKKNESTGSGKLDRKTAERNRRIQMKNLCSKLTSLIPPRHLKYKSPKNILSQQDQFDQAASYIEQLKERIEELKERKNLAMGINGINSKIGNTMRVGPRLPVVELKELDSAIEVVLISGLTKNFSLNEVISVLEEAGAEVVSASYTTVADKVRVSRVGVETSSVYQRLQELVSDSLTLS